jgi:hypothetical protein
MNTTEFSPSQHVDKKTTTLLYEIPDTNYVKHKEVKNTLPSHHVKHDDTQVPPK